MSIAGNPRLYEIEPRRVSVDRIRDRLYAAMGEYRARVEESWGLSFSEFLTYVSYATAPASHGLALLQESIREDPQTRTLVIGGAYGCGSALDGSDSPTIAGSILAMDLIRVESSWVLPKYVFRDLRKAQGAYCAVFSGAVRKSEQFGEHTGLELCNQFNILTSQRYADVVFADDMSLNTGYQGRILAALIQSMDAKRVVMTLPIEHTARMAATIAHGLGNSACTFYFVSPCEWGENDPLKYDLTRSDLAFGPVVTNPDQTKQTKASYGGEYTSTRYQTEQNPHKNQQFICAALSPADMIRRYLPRFL